MSATYAVEVAFGIGPLAVPAGGDWIAITSYVREISIRRGRTHELDRTQAGEAVLRLRNTDRRFDATYAAGPYYPNVRPMAQIRVRATVSAVTYELFRGYVEDWGQSWPRPLYQAGDAEVTVKAVDAFKLLGLLSMTSLSPEILADSPLAYWPLNEASGPDIANLGTHEDLEGTIVGPVTTGTGPLAGGQTALEFDGTINAYVVMPDTVDLDLEGALTVEFWARLTTLASISFPFRSGAGSPSVELMYVSGGVGWSFRYRAADTSTYSIDLGVTATVNTWQHWAFTVDENRLLTCYKNGVAQASATIPHSRVNTAPHTAQLGYVTYGRLAQVAVWDSAISPARIAVHAAANVEMAEQLSGSHIDEVLDAAGWPAGLRDLDAGTSVIAAVSPTGNVLEWLLGIAEETEAGVLFMAGDSDVTFRDRAATFTDANQQTSQATYSDDPAAGSEHAYADLSVRYDDADLYPIVSVGRTGGITAKASDATGISNYGPRTLERSGLELASDEEVIDRAAGLLERYKAPALRFDQLVVVADSDTLLTQAFSRILRDRLTVKRNPPAGGTALSADVHVEGIQLSINPARASAVAVWSLSPAAPTTPWILNDTTYSVLGSTTILGW